ncbi:MAG: hypothetical protein KC731_16320 [Myxococcales bacterium]|nr:hypothetical protein [Myxococcales bacterium]
MSTIAAWGLVALGVVIILVYAQITGSRQMKRILGRLATIGEARLEDGGTVAGTLGDHAYRLKVTSRSVPGSDTSQMWLECHVPMDIGDVVFDLTAVVPGAGGALLEEVRRGERRDVLLGDPAFDEAYVVEVAPEGLAPLALTADVRREILALAPLEIQLTGEGALMLGSCLWHEERVAQIAEVSVTVARSLTSAAKQVVEEPRAGAGYRAMDRSARAAAQLDVSTLEALRRDRAEGAERRGRMMFVAMVAMAAGLFALAAYLMWA